MFQYLKKIKSFAIVGATGLVGEECLKILDEFKVRFERLKLLASSRSIGKTLSFGSSELAVEELVDSSFNGVEAAFFSVPKPITKKFVPIALSSGCVVVDDSNCYRMKNDVPLVVPEVNKNALSNSSRKLISTPNCTTTPLALALKPLHDKFELKRLVVSTYQSVSGAGRRATNELSKQCSSLLNGIDIEPEVFPHRIAFNCIPRIGDILENGYSEEEEKVGNELRKILSIKDLRVSVTAVRVPTFFCHALSANIEFFKPFGSVEEIRELLDNFPGLKVLDKPSSDIYPTNREASGSDFTFIGRIRRDYTVESGINIWVVSDNLRKGAALNALQCLDAYYSFTFLN